MPLICDDPECPDTSLYVVNVLNCVKCLDREKTIWEDSRSGRKVHIKEFAFACDRLPQPGLFKIPEKITTGVFVYERVSEDGSIQSFKKDVEDNDFKGLRFLKVWEEIEE